MVDFEKEKNSEYNGIDLGTIPTAILQQEINIRRQAHARGIVNSINKNLNELRELGFKYITDSLGNDWDIRQMRCVEFEDSEDIKHIRYDVEDVEYNEDYYR